MLILGLLLFCFCVRFNLACEIMAVCNVTFDMVVICKVEVEYGEEFLFSVKRNSRYLHNLHSVQL